MNQNDETQKYSMSSYLFSDEQEERQQYLRIVVYFVLFVTGSLTLSHLAQKIQYTPIIIGFYFLSILPALREEFRNKYYHFWSWHVILGAILVDGLTVIFTGRTSPTPLFLIIPMT